MTFKICDKCDCPDICFIHSRCLEDELQRFHERRDSDPMMVILYVIASFIIAIAVILTVIFLSSRPAGASHGPTGYVISDCCIGTHRATGTSYRTVALVLQSRSRSVFETGTRPVELILSWPQLPSVTQEHIRLAQQRLAVVMAAHQAPKHVRASASDGLKSQQTWRAIGMACLFGGIMIFAVFSTSRPRS